MTSIVKAINECADKTFVFPVHPRTRNILKNLNLSFGPHVKLIEQFPGIKVFHPYERYLENKFHKNANIITTVSEPLADSLRSITNTPVKVIYNGYDEEDFSFLFEKERDNNDKFIISYLGTIYRPFRNPEPLFKAIADLDNKGLISANDIKINFDGGQADVMDYVNKYGINDYYEYLGMLPREESLKLQYNSDAVLFLEYENPEVKGILTGKLFEYLFQNL